MFILSKFADRLKEQKSEDGLNNTQIAKLLNINSGNVSRYVRGINSPDYKTFIAMLKIFNCSADYLLGLVDIPPDIESFYDPLPFGERLRAVLKEYGKSQYYLEREKNYSPSLVYDWLNGNKLPNPASLAKLAEDLDCKADYLLGRIR